MSSSEEGRGCPVPIWRPQRDTLSFEDKQISSVYEKIRLVTKSIVFFLLVSDRVWSTKVTQRPLQSSGSSTPIKKA